MTQAPRPVKKKAVSGSIQPRWPKPRVVRWLEAGAIPALVGLWFPDWVGAYGGSSWHASLMPAAPPIVAYVGVMILLVACYQGIKDMGSHFRGVVACGALSVSMAVASVVAQLLNMSALSLLATGLAAFFGAGFIWFTIGKVAEITQETRTRTVWLAVGILSVVSAVVYLFGVYLFAFGDPSTSLIVLRSGVGLLSLTFVLCRYGVHCYKTQTSIGAAFRVAPDDQYWASAG